MTISTPAAERQIAGAVQRSALREPFPPEQIGQRPVPLDPEASSDMCPDCGLWHQLPARHLDYVGHAAVTARLLDVDDLWNWAPLSLDERGLPAFDEHGGLWITLTVAGVTRIGYGAADGRTGPDAIKEAIGDAIRNAGMRCGVALSLWQSAPVAARAGEPATADAEDDWIAASRELIAALSAAGIPPVQAAAKFAELGHGDLGTSRDATAIRALAEHYRAEDEERARD